MKISVFGTGYVGLVTGVCFAEMGHTVHGVDIIESKIQQLRLGQSTIYEPTLNTLLQKNIKLKRISFSCNNLEAVTNSDIIFISVGSPADTNGSADLSLVLVAAESIAKVMTSYKLIVIKSTVPVGSSHLIKTKIIETLKARNIKIPFDIASNPEFLREGSAIADCLNPYRIIVGSSSSKAIGLLEQVYATLINKNIPFIIMDSNSAEMTKYAANCILATKITLMNEISRLCEKLNANIDNVHLGVGSDHRIGQSALHAGLGYGGSCFPKDVEALIQMGLDQNENLQIIKAVALTNKLQSQKFLSKILTRLPDLKNKPIAIWGVAFKPNTDDIREAPSLFLIENLIRENAQIKIYDPAASENLKLHFKNNPNLHFFSDPYLALDSAEALIIPTEWEIFLKPDFSAMKLKMKNALVFDGRNIYTPTEMKRHGFEYYSIGRPQV
ncbi:MAG: UDP-glucose/GDP-mannose dehydrogenase family protein [Pseudobdellovibrio sp.]